MRRLLLCLGQAIDLKAVNAGGGIARSGGVHDVGVARRGGLGIEDAVGQCTELAHISLHRQQLCLDLLERGLLRLDIGFLLRHCVDLSLIDCQKPRDQAVGVQAADEAVEADRGLRRRRGRAGSKARKAAHG